MKSPVRLMHFLSIPGVLFAAAMFSNAHDGLSNAASGMVVTAAADQADTDSSEGKISGQGEYRFRVLHTREFLPQEAVAVLEKAHGGFAVDRREGKGEVYFALPGAGIIRLSRDLKTAELLPTPEEVKAPNLHNTTIWFGEGDQARLVFPANDIGKVFTTTLEGELLNVLDAPTGETRFDHQEVSEYFKKGEKFAPTDVEYMNRMYYVTTGYSPLDYVLTARTEGSSVSAQWNGLAFGGKGDGKGQFQTGHGITVSADGDYLDIADRPVAEIERFSPEGKYLSTVKLPEGAWPCDIDYTEGLACVPCLYGPDHSKGAPVYLMQEGKIISTIMPKEELGLEKFQHIHNAVLTRYEDKLYLIVQAWNPRDFAILEQVVDGGE
jgi:hypothetical protein